MIFRTIALSILLVCALAKQEAQSRRLDDNNSTWWIKKYNLKYEHCFHTENVASYRLCPSENRCREKCTNGGEYLADMATFIDAYTEAQMKAKEYQCEMAQENCQSDDEYECYMAAGLTDCYKDNYDDNSFNLQKYLDCKQISDYLYVGPYCGEDNYSIYLGVFNDTYCTYPVEAKAFSYVKGYDLPYSSTSIITDDCLLCNEQGDEGDEDDVLEQCEELYEYTYTKCESNLNDAIYPIVTGCEVIETIKKVEGVPLTNSSGPKWAYFHLIWMGSLLVLCASLYELLRQGERKRELESLGDGESVCYFLFSNKKRGSNKNTEADMEYYMQDDTESEGSGGPRLD
jgi:hypothetical protein